MRGAAEARTLDRAVFKSLAHFSSELVAEIKVARTIGRQLLTKSKLMDHYVKWLYTVAQTVVVMVLMLLQI